MTVVAVGAMSVEVKNVEAKTAGKKTAEKKTAPMVIGVAIAIESAVRWSPLGRLPQ